jgi:hypothetical protein
VAQTVKITPASGLLEFIGNTTSNKPYLQHDDNGNLTLTLQATKKFTVAGNLKVNGKVTMAQQTLTDGAAITWDFNSGANAKVTLAGARTLVLSNMETGDTGLILVKQDAAGSRTLTLPGSSSIVGGGTYTASPAANATDVLGVYYDGTTYWWTIGYNTVTPPLTSVGITGADFTIANSPLTANGNIGLALATVNSNVGQFGSATAVPVITVNAKGLVTAVSATNISIPTNLDSLTDVTITSAATNQLLQFNGSQWVNWTPNYITSYTETDPTVPSHVKSITTTEKSNWNTAYGWGNHATAGYLTSVTNISGYAGTLIREDNRTISPSELTAGQMKFGFTSWTNDNNSPYADFIHMRSYTDSSGGTDNLIMFKKSGIGMRIWQQTWGSTSPYSSYVDAWTTGNFTQTDVNNWNTAYGWGNHATQGYATQTYVNTAVSNLVASSPAALDTLNELAAALGNDASFSTTVSTALGNRLRVDINTQGLTATQKGYGRTNLGVVIGTDVQAWDGDLDAIAALAATSGFLKKTAANTWSLDTNTYITGNQTITLSGDITGSGTTSISTALSNTGVTASTYKSVTVDAKGRVTAGSNPTTLAGYGITNAVTYGDYITQSVFSGKTITVNPVIIKELLFGGSNRYTQTDSYTGTYPNAGSTWVRTYRLNNGENAVYSSGNVYLGFWVNYPPANVTVRVRNTSGVYYGPFTGSDISITGQFAFWKIPCGGANFIDTWEITFTPQAGLGVNLQTVNIAIDNGEGIDQFPIVHRDGSTMYGRLNFMSGGSVRAYVDPSGAIYGSGNFTANSFVKAGGTSTQFLKADGSVDSSSYITLTSLSGSTGISYNNTTGAISSTITQYTDALARAAHSFTAGSGAYNATTGVITIPTNNNQLTNGAGYITSYAETDTLASVTGRGATTNTASVFAGGLYARKAQGDGDYTTAALWTESYNNTTTGIAFHISGVVGKFLEMRVDQRLYWDNSQVWTAGNLTNLNQLTNGPAYITTSALSGYATQTYVNTAVSNLVASAPSTLDTLNELATALGNDANFATTITTSIGNKVSKSGDTMTGNLAFGATSGLGLTWGLNTDAAFIKFISTGNQAGGSYLEIGTQDDSNEEIKFTQSGALKFYLATDGNLKTGSGYNYVWENGTWAIGISGNAATATNVAWTGVTGRPTALSQFSNDLGNYGGWLTQAAANPLYVNVTGDTMTGPLVITGSTSGQELFAVNGVNGRLFTVSDDLSNSLFSVNTVAGLPVIEAFANNTVNIGPFSAPIVINASGISTPSHGTSANWNSAYNDTITSAAVSGTTSKTLTLTQRDGGTVTATWTDIDTDTNTDAQTLSLSGNTLSISGGNSVTLASTGISQATADGLYVNIGGDEMTGNLYISPISANPAQIQLAGSNPELYVSAKTGTARVFISRQGTGNQATLMFMTAMGTYQGTAWDYTGAPMWSMGMTNNANTNSFKLGYGDIYDPTVVALEITTANTAYFKYVPYAAGNLLATQSWVTSQGYITGYTETDTLASVTGRGATTSTPITITGSEGREVAVYIPSSYTTNDLVSGHEYQWYNDHWRLGMTRSGGAAGADFVIQWNAARRLSLTSGGNLSVTGTISATNFSGSSSGTNTGDQTNISGNAATATTAGALTSMNISQFTNNSGYLTSITSGNVTTALGYTPWHAGNDGAGSGLDADLLDGYTSDTAANVNTIVRRDSSGNIYSNYVLGSYFNASAGNSENPTIGQIWTQNTSDNYLRKSTPGHFRSQVTDSYYLSLSGGTLSGNLNIIGELAFRDGSGGFYNIIRAAAYPSEGFAAGSNYWLEYQSRGGHHFVLNTDGGVGGGANTMDDFVIWQGAIDGDRLLEVSNTGTLTIANRLIELSSIRYKTQVESLTPALDKVLQLRPVHYVKIGGTGETEIGLIAEEVAEIYPELVKYDSEGQVDGINYTRIAPILIKTIQEQHEIIKKLTERIENLENR